MGRQRGASWAVYPAPPPPFPFRPYPAPHQSVSLYTTPLRTQSWDSVSGLPLAPTPWSLRLPGTGVHHQVSGGESAPAPRDAEGQGGLARCRSRGAEWDSTERLHSKRSDHLNLNFWLWGLSIGFCVFWLFFFF